MPLYNPGILATGGSVTGNLTVTGNLVTNGTTTSSGSLTASAGIADTGDISLATGNLLVNTAGKGLQVKEGANAKMGTATANGTTEVTVSTTAVTATSRILLTIQTPNAGTAGAVYVSSRVAGTSFGFKSTDAADASTVAWMIVEPA